MKHVKKLLALLLMVAMLLPLLPAIPVHAETTITSGSCGDDVSYTLDNDGCLTISGTGEMTSAPYGRNMTSVIIENGVTSICVCLLFGADECDDWEQRDKHRNRSVQQL